MSNSLFEKKVHGQKHHREGDKCRNSIPHINLFMNEYYKHPVKYRRPVNGKGQASTDHPFLDHLDVYIQITFTSTIHVQYLNHTRRYQEKINSPIDFGAYSSTCTSYDGPTGPRWAPCWPHELCYLENIRWFISHKKQISILIRVTIIFCSNVLLLLIPYTEFFVFCGS